MFTRKVSSASLPGIVCGLAAWACLASCSTAPVNEARESKLDQMSNDTVARMEQVDSSLHGVLDNALAYAVFPSVGEGAAGIGGAYGRGQLYEHGKMTGYCDLSQGTIGVQLGGQKYMELIVFRNDAALARFKANDFAFAAEAAAIAAKDGAAASANYADGVGVFTHPVSGLIFAAAIGGQRFTYVSKSNADAQMRTAAAE